MVIRLNWLEEIELRRYAGLPGRQYCLLLTRWEFAGKPSERPTHS